MERKDSSPREDFPLDRQIQKTNNICKEYKLPPIQISDFKRFNLLDEEHLKEHRQEIRKNGELKVNPAWGKSNHIVLHFNKYTELGLERKFKEHIATVNFAEAYAARKFLDAFFASVNAAYDDTKQKWMGPNQLHVANWFIVHTDPDAKVTLEDLMEYTYTKEEMKWRLPIPYPQKAQSIAAYHFGSHPTINSVSRDEAHLPKLTETQLSEKRKALGLKDNKPAPKYEQKKPDTQTGAVAKTPKASPDGTTISQLAVQIKMSPGEARRILRANKVPKPYAWKDTADIIKMLEKGRKK